MNCGLLFFFCLAFAGDSLRRVRRSGSAVAMLMDSEQPLGPRHTTRGPAGAVKEAANDRARWGVVQKNGLA